MYTFLIIIALWCNFATCRDFYVGMFKKNDILVAQDRLFKERVPFRSSYAKYGRKFKCPITYFRVVDRLGYGKGPRVDIVRGGLRKHYVVLRLQSAFNTPISVNIYVGCENKMPRTFAVKATTAAMDSGNDTGAEGGGNSTVDGEGGGNGTAAEGGSTAADGAPPDGEPAPEPPAE